MTARNGDDHVIIIGASILTEPAYRVARDELGLRTIAVDYNPDAPGMKLADVALPISTKDPKAVVEGVRALGEKVRPVGVFTCGADVEITVSRVAKALGLPGIPPEAADVCNDKLLMHRHLDRCGFQEKPAYRVVTSARGAEAAAHDLGVPVVLKPIDNCGSRGVQRIDQLDDVAAAFEYAAGFNLGRSAPEVLVEECVTGTKHTVEMIAEGGRWHLSSICDTHYTSPRWPCESRLTTTALDGASQARIFEFSERVARLVGVDFGGHKVDVNIGPDGSVKLIELTARLSGGFHCQYASPLAYGTHEIRAVLRLVAGRGFVAGDLSHVRERAAVVEAVFPAPGRVTAIEGVEAALASEGVHRVFVTTQVGATISDYRNSTDRVAFVIADGDDVPHAIERATAGAAKLRIRTQATP